jgi:hypothetical protein
VIEMMQGLASTRDLVLKCSAARLGCRPCPPGGRFRRFGIADELLAYIAIAVNITEQIKEVLLVYHNPRNLD